jgi:iduronate 2-sulfatase
MKLSLGIILFLMVGGLTAADRPNVLLILSDDLRPQLGCYGDETVISPNIDAFAETAVRFERAYVQQAVCSPSRNSFLSGLRPESTGLMGFGTKLREKVPDAVTLPQHFKNNGYRTVGMGKVYHVYAETGLGSEDDAESWSEPLYEAKNPVWGPEQEADRAKRIAADQKAGVVYNHSHDWPRGESFDDPDVPDDALRDGEIALKAVEFLQAHAENPDQPFFLAVGFFLPHLPFVAPKKYFDMYEDVEIPIPENQDRRIGAPTYAAPFGWAGETHYVNMPPEDQRGSEYQRAALEETGLADNTIVLFAGDHGYMMGEYGSWGSKHCNYEMAVRAPVLVRAPGIEPGTAEGLVEFIDFYATLADLAGLPEPARHEGTSFVPLLDDPHREWKLGALSIMRRGGNVGRAIRTDGYRYVSWRNRQGKKIAEELYDYERDPDEGRNLVDLPEYTQVLKRHQKLLEGGWQGLRPN